MKRIYCGLLALGLALEVAVYGQVREAEGGGAGGGARPRGKSRPSPP